ncbi:MAG: SIMPL domain-containing protein [Candidatus Pacebacteria bacterium]|jgi:uncharacterized protein|nr:SIMPL domain-containing protein [Candidatus Paceibacterota bacterium]MBT6756592.1 SIMPL domain-containing protein [Candidatus Paceibacterota bacterium]MBT6920931.1 SIMPL domain-containing protein [Candidatus Paceibacterota bacterium]
MQIPSYQKGPKTILIILALVAFAAWTQRNGFEWGTVQLASPSTITVTGMADGSQINKKASFSATITAKNTDKETAVKELTTETNILIEQIKSLGIEEKDIKTQSLNVYEIREPEHFDDEVTPLMQMQEIETSEFYYPGEPEKTIKKWQASNTLSITINDASAEKTSEMADMLINSGATNVYGPNFQAGNTADLEKELLEQAMKNAEEKAEILLKNSKQKIKRIIQVNEGYNSYPTNYKYAMPMMAGMDMAESIQVEPGSQDVTKTVTVIFEIR